MIKFTSHFPLLNPDAIYKGTNFGKENMQYIVNMQCWYSYVQVACLAYLLYKIVL